MTPALLLLAAVVLILFSAVLSAAETAAFSVSEVTLRTLGEEGFEDADELAGLRAEPGAVHTAILVIDSLATLVAVGMLTSVVYQEFGQTPALLAIVLIAAAVLLLAEVIPRAIASRHPVRLALASAPFLRRLERWSQPVLSPLIRLEDYLSRRNDRSGEPAVDLPERREALELMEIGQVEGVVDEDEHLLLERVFRLDELTAWDVMTPRTEVFALPDAKTLAQVVEDLSRVPHSRIPVYGESIDDITGVVYVREVYERHLEGATEIPLSRIAREPFFIPGSRPLTELLRDFQARRIHMGIVSDDYGGTDGIVTLEDVLEELVGEIMDETDVDEEPILRISRNEIVVDAGLDLREINYAFNATFPYLEHRSLNGFILEEFGAVPGEGDSFVQGGIRVEVIEATDTQVLKARLKRLPPEEGG